MSRSIRQVLTAMLVLLFSSESIALASILQDDSGNVSRKHSISQQDIPSLFNLIAEENEERDERDNDSPYAACEIQDPYFFPSAALSKNNTNWGSNFHPRTVPLYTILCKLII